MKKIRLLLALLIGISVSLNAQIYIEESFDNSEMPPSGWSIDEYQNQWGISSTDHSGGDSPEGRYARVAATGTTRLISPEIDLTGETVVMFSFKHKVFDRNSNSYSVGVATRSGSGDWTTIWEIFPTGDTDPEEQLMAFTNSDVGEDDFQFCLFIDGNLNNLSFWFMDDLKLFIPFELDAAMIEITTDDMVYNAAEVTGIIKNVGQNTITELEMNWQVPGEEIHTSTISDISVEPSELYDFTCDDIFFFPVGNYELEVWVTKVNGEDDMNPNDNSLTKEIEVTSVQTISRVPFFEEFTSSTCGPCAGFNSTFVPWCEDHADQITLLKYQMDWPGAGDPYHTPECDVRRSYYNFNSVPYLFANGTNISTNVGAIDNWFNDAVQLPGYILIAGSFSLDGTVITIDANVLPLDDFSNVRFHAVVFEKLTTQNTGNNGETEFEHVMMKMVPDAYGTTLDLTANELFEFSHTLDIGNTHVEEWDDLGVVFFVQEYSSKQVQQSAYGLEDYTYSSDARLSAIRVDNNAIGNFDPDVYEYNVELEEGQTEVVSLFGVPFEGNPTISYEYPDAIPGTATIHVRAEDLSSTSTYTVNMSLYTGINDSFEQSVQVFPNPTTGLIYINGIENADISVYGINGKLINSSDMINGNSIDLSSLPNGIYLIKVQKDGAVLTKKISLNRS